MATAYERECVEAGHGAVACKRHIGRRHRACLDEGAVALGDGEYRYTYEGYAGCMRPSRGADLAAPVE